jgi:hypothetical protein
MIAGQFEGCQVKFVEEWINFLFVERKCRKCFVHRQNSQDSPLYRPDPNAILVDAFTFNWGTNFNYIFPPFSILGAVLRKIVEDKADAILIAPLFFSTKMQPFLDITPILSFCGVSS